MTDPMKEKVGTIPRQARKENTITHFLLVFVEVHLSVHDIRLV